MRKYLLGIITVALAIGSSAFTKDQKQNKTIRGATVFTDVWYTYSGAASQTAATRSDKTNYTSPNTSQPSCSGSDNACAIRIVNVSGTPPSNISSFTVTFDANGFAVGGSDFGELVQKN